MATEDRQQLSLVPITIDRLWVLPDAKNKTTRALDDDATCSVGQALEWCEIVKIRKESAQVVCKLLQILKTLIDH